MREHATDVNTSTVIVYDRYQAVSIATDIEDSGDRACGCTAQKSDNGSCKRRTPSAANDAVVQNLK
jgi:hypothetical protein